VNTANRYRSIRASPISLTRQHRSGAPLSIEGSLVSQRGSNNGIGGVLIKAATPAQLGLAH
jgi:hypothetical protein